MKMEISLMHQRRHQAYQALPQCIETIHDEVRNTHKGRVATETAAWCYEQGQTR